VVQKPGDLCRPGEQGPLPQGPLAIDVHAHVFNASDLQVHDFIAKVSNRSRLNRLYQAWKLTPPWIPKVDRLPA